MITVEPGKGILADLSKVTERQGKTGPYLMWEFFDEHNNRYVGFTDASVIMGGRTWTWLCMLGVHLDVGAQIDLSQLTSIECLIFVEGEKDIVRMVARADKLLKKEEPKQTKTPTSVTSVDEASILFD